MTDPIPSTDRIAFNVNSTVRVKLTDIGRAELKRQHAELFNSVAIVGREFKPPAEDAEGWSRWQLWSLMEELGALCHIGMNPPFETEIQLELERRPSPEPAARRVTWISNLEAGQGFMWTAGDEFGPEIAGQSLIVRPLDSEGIHAFRNLFARLSTTKEG